MCCFGSVRNPLALLIPEYSGIKRRGTTFPGLRNPGISHYSDKHPLSFFSFFLYFFFYFFNFFLNFLYCSGFCHTLK